MLDARLWAERAVVCVTLPITGAIMAGMRDRLKARVGLPADRKKASISLFSCHTVSGGDRGMPHVPCAVWLGTEICR